VLYPTTKRRPPWAISDCSKALLLENLTRQASACAKESSWNKTNLFKKKNLLKLPHLGLKVSRACFLPKILGQFYGDTFFFFKKKLNATELNLPRELLELCAAEAKLLDLAGVEAQMKRFPPIRALWQ
jgi:hypothetical protein